MTTEPAEPSARTAIFDWLKRKYVQRQDARQKALGLVYMEAETHDLAEAIEGQIAAHDTEIARLQAQVAELADALNETLTATAQPIPAYESGIDAQIRWVDRIAAARKDGHAALAKVGR